MPSRARTARRTAAVASRDRRLMFRIVPSQASCSMAEMVQLQAISWASAGLSAGPSSRWQRSGQAGWLTGSGDGVPAGTSCALASGVAAGTSLPAGSGVPARACGVVVDDDLVYVGVVGGGDRAAQVAGGQLPD